MRWLFHLRRVLKAHLPSLLKKDDRGQGLVEYALILALVVFASIAGLRVFACHINCAYENVGNKAEQIFTHGKKIPPGQEKKCSKKCD
jgi:Flp pilus assembly pilin Flp